MATAESVQARSTATTSSRWSGHRLQAGLVRFLVYAAPLAGSIIFVHYASKEYPAPRGSVLAFVAWWLVLSVAATVVLVAIDRVTRRLLPLAALLKLSLVFPDEAPSRFKVALRSGSVERLQERITEATEAARTATPTEAATVLLELVALLNIHDKLTRGHCDRVRAYAVLIGKEMGLSPEELDCLNWAALLHDVGKLEVPEEILGKSGSPTFEEWQVLRKHTVYGEALVEPIRSWLGRWLDAVGHHHERWDGTGYPRGLAGEDIPLAGRIVAVADVFDVMTSVRSYKKASAVEDARKEIARCAGTQFDPRVVRAFLNVSLGRMRLVVGPLSLLAHAPLLGRLPFTPAMGTLAGAFTVAATSAAGGIAAPQHQHPHVVAPPVPAPHVRHAVAHAPKPRPLYVHLVQAPRPPANPPAKPPPAPLSPSFPPPPPPPAPQPAPAPAPAPPTAANDTASAYEGESTEIDVLANDTGGPFTLQSVDAPAHGSATIIGDRIVYRSQAGFHGTDTFAYHASSAAGNVSATVTVQVLGVNQPPRFVAGPAVTVDEDGLPYATAWATGIDAGAGDSGQQVHFDVLADHPDLFSSQPRVAPDGTLTFTVAGDVFGSSRVTVTAVDDGGTAHGGVDTSAARTLTLTIRPVNDPPTFTGGGNVSVIEDLGPQSLPWASAIAPGPANESDQHVTFETSADQLGLFATGGEPLVSPTGVLTFTPAFHASGTATVTVTAHDDGGTANGGVDTSQPQTFTITIGAVNHAPSFVVGASQTVLEDSGAHAVPTWATDVSPGPANESAQNVTFDVSTTDPGLFLVAPAVSQAGTLTYTTAANANGSATVTVTAHDDGGTANGGVDMSAPQSFTITVVPVNDPPSFQPGADQTTLEDSGAQTVAGWATAISAGPSDESSQNVTFSVLETNGPLFATPPAVAPDGTLTYTPAANANGSSTVTVTEHDDGGTADGGQDTSPGQTFTITLIAVNDPPSFVAGGDQTVLEGSGAQTVASWATSISAGPADESGQAVTFGVGETNASLFSVAPAVSTSGVLTYTPATGALGSSTVTVTPQDDGGTANGGVDTGAPQSFTILVEAPPVAVDDSYSTTIDTDADGNLLTNDSDPQGSSLTLDTSPASPPVHGSVSLSADGSFVYTPDAGYTGTDGFVYTATNALGLSSTATVTIAITAPVTASLVSATNSSNSFLPYAVTSNSFTPENGATYLVFAGRASGPLDTAVLSTSGSLLVTNLGLPVNSVVGADASTYAWVWEVHGTGANPSTVTATFLEASSKALSTQADVLEVVQIDGSSPWYVGSGTANADTLTSAQDATVPLATPGAGHSELAFLYVNGDIGGTDPGWATVGISTTTGSYLHHGGADDGFGALVAYAPQALASATTNDPFPAHAGDVYVSLSFELLP